MGIALNKLGEADRRRIAESLFTVKTTDDHKSELHGLCPIHGEKNPSFSYSLSKDIYNCFSCGASGDLVELYSHVKGLDKKEGFKAFCRDYGIQNDQSGSPGPQQPRPDPSISSENLEDVWKKFPPMPDGWINRLKSVRGWSQEAIETMDIRQQTFYLCKKSGRVKPVAKKEWRKIAIPIRDTKGNLKNIRLYKPGAKKFKLISWGKGFGEGRLFPQKPLTDDPVILLEGEADTICAISKGLNAITQTSKRMRWPKDQLKPFKGRDVVICYDADQPGQKYAKAAAACLKDIASRVRLLEWPDFMGRLADDIWPEKGGQDLTDFFVRHEKSVDDFLKLIEAAELPPEPKRGTGETGGCPEDFFKVGLNDRWAFKPRLLARRILENFNLCSDPTTGVLYRWNDEYWEPFHEDYVSQAAYKFLGDESKTQWVNDAVTHVKKLSTLPKGREMNDQIEWTCLKNGMFNVITKELRPHDKDYFSSFQLPVTFDPEKTPKASRWVSFLDEAVQTPDVINQLQEFAGLCLTRDVKYAKCFILVGPGSDGKSTYIKLLRKMVGPENCSAVSFNELERHFQRASLYGKVLNVSTEVGSDALQSNYFKAIVTGDPIDASYKFRDSFTFTPFAKLIFATNRMPRVLDTSDGFYRRIIPVTFKQQFMGDDDDKDLETKLENELSGIFEWALIGLDRLRKNKDFTPSDETASELHNYRRLNNPVLCFTEEELEIDTEGMELKEHVYQKYRTWSGEAGLQAYGKINFFRELHNCITTLTNFRPRTENGRQSFIKGVRYIGEVRE